MWIFEKENKSTKIILVISVNIFRLLRPLQCRPKIKLIRKFQRGLSFCFDCPCGAAIWSGCDDSAIAPAKNAKQNKKILGCN